MQSNNFLLDGVDNNESLVNSIVFFTPPEAIQDANPNYFQPGTTAPAFQRKQFGFAAGGPIWKDKLFIFADYQAMR